MPRPLNRPQHRDTQYCPWYDGLHIIVLLLTAATMAIALCVRLTA